MLLLLFGFAATVSVLMPTAFFAWGPVPERRANLGLTYLTVVVIGWCAALTLGFLSPLAAGGAAALLSAFGVLAASYSWRDERLLADLDAALDDPSGRERALERLRDRLGQMGRDSSAVVALMEVAAFPAQRLVSRGHFLEAQELLDFIDLELGARLGRVDRSELRLLQARVDLQLGHVERARDRLSVEREVGTAFPHDARLLEALLEVTTGASADAARGVGELSGGIWSEWSRSLAQLIEAHIAAARGDDDRALRRLRNLRPSYRECLLALARALPGPATELARRVDGHSVPYR